MTYFVYVSKNQTHVMEAVSIAPHSFENKRDAELYREQLRAHYGFPISPLPTRKQSRQRVKCWQTGTIYKNASEAAAAFSVTPSAMSQHLNHPDRYQFIRTIYTFERVKD